MRKYITFFALCFFPVLLHILTMHKLFFQNIWLHILYALYVFIMSIIFLPKKFFPTALVVIISFCLAEVLGIICYMILYNAFNYQFTNAGLSLMLVEIGISSIVYLLALAMYLLSSKVLKKKISQNN